MCRMALTVVTVTGTFVYSNAPGVIPTGYVSFVPNATVLDPNNNDIRVVFPVRAVLDGAGHISVSLVATDNAGLSPSGWAYDIHIHVGATADDFTTFIPSTPNPVDLSALAPASSVPMFQYVLTSAVGAPNGVASLNSSGDVPLTELANGCLVLAGATPVPVGTPAGTIIVRT